MTIGTLAPTVDAVDVRNPRYQELKGRVHDTLLSRLNLERLTGPSARTRNRKSAG